MRWTASAPLMCLQEITENYMIEFFKDAYLLAGHAHRLTIQPRDLDILCRVRYRYDQLLIPGDIVDNRSRDILTLPPVFPHAATVQRAPLVHSRNTDLRSKRVLKVYIRCEDG